MKIRFWNDNNANTHSMQEEVFELEELGLTEEEWKKMSEVQKEEMVSEWALEMFYYGYEEMKND
jgi:hypothetical protein